MKPWISLPVIQERIRQWERQYVTVSGCFRGPPQIGFPYEQGEYIPITARYSAMLQHQGAKRAYRRKHDA